MSMPRPGFEPAIKILETPEGSVRGQKLYLFSKVLQQTEDTSLKTWA